MLTSSLSGGTTAGATTTGSGGAVGLLSGAATTASGLAGDGADRSAPPHAAAVIRKKPAGSIQNLKSHLLGRERRAI